MNERVKELAEQAGEYTNSVYTPPVRSKTPGKIWEDGHTDWHELYNEKFPEVIVQECCEVGAQAFLKGNRIVPVFPANQIKEPFGVEE